MPKVKIEKKSNLPAKESYEKIKNMLENDQDLRKLDPKYVCQFDDQEMSGTAKGGQFSANMTISNSGEGSAVALVVELPLMLAPFKGMVQSTLQKKIDSTLG